MIINDDKQELDSSESTNSEEVVAESIEMINDEADENIEVVVSELKEVENPEYEKKLKVDYLDSNILKLKSYDLNEINDIDKEINSVSAFENEDLYAANIAELNEKQLVTGKVVAVNDKEVLIDIGFKSEGTVSLSEFDIVPTIGEEVEIFLVVFEDRHGRLILSKERADFENKWLKLRNAFNDESEIIGTITKRIKGGMVVDLGGVNSFLPGSQIDIKPVSDFDSYLNKEFNFKIVKFNEMRQNIVVSRKALMSDSYDQNKKEILEKLDVGTELDGMVKNITDFGAFIDLGNGIDGLLHITDITWGRINHPSDKLSIGENIKVKVIDIDEVKNRISLGTKQLASDPWANIKDKYSENTKVVGKVVNIMNYGIFIEVEEGIEGLVHISEFSWTKHIKHPADIYKVGDKLDVIILSVDIDNKKISLGIKQLSENPWSKVEDKYKVGDIFKGSINNLITNGFYVQIDDDIEGFVANANISWTRKIKNPADIYKQNDNVEVKLIDISSEEKKIHLGIKQLTDDPWDSIDSFVNEKDSIEGKILFTMDKGIVVLLENDFEGIIPASKLNDSIDNYKVNDKLSLIVEEVNSQNRRIALSINNESSNNDNLTDNDENSNNSDNPDESKE